MQWLAMLMIKKSPYWGFLFLSFCTKTVENSTKSVILIIEIRKGSCKDGFILSLLIISSRKPVTLVMG